MTTTRSGDARQAVRAASMASLVTVLLAGTGAATARAASPCTRTARLQYAACRHEMHDDRLVTKASCINLEDPKERAECLAELPELQGESAQLCRAQRDARLAVCALVGEARYDPDFDPADFEAEFLMPQVVNAYLPLVIGNRWDYAASGSDETSTVEVIAGTKLVDGVTCVVSRDEVRTSGVAKELTDDWLAQAANGDVYYCGEEVKDFELFPGDVPPAPELVSLDGSFKAGRDGDRPGILFPGAPIVGATYRQEFSLGNAEDVATVLATDYDFGDDATLDEHVPQALADHLCDDDCVVTADRTAIDPGPGERKYYSPGVGLFLEVSLRSGEINRLVDCNVDPRCATLPPP